MRYNNLMKFALVVLAALVGITGCGRDRQPSVGETPDLKLAIVAIKGTYEWRNDLSRYEFSEKLKLEEILSLQSPELATTTLIGCLDDTSASASLMDGKPVAVGIVCYEALTQLVYYEPTEPSGDIAASWPGIIAPQASRQEMRDAKAVWEKAADARLLIFQ